MNFETSKSGHSFVRGESRAGADWPLLDQLRQRWKGKLVVKSVMSPADAVRIRDAGADSVYVSNHGGRQLNSAPAAISALPRIRAAVGVDYPLIFDSGVRSGEDVVKALTLGADFVMIGRPMMFAVGAEDARGLASLIDILAEEISVTLAQIGLRRVEEIDRTVLAGTGPPAGARIAATGSVFAEDKTEG
jgi:L-lactate dehydrogenase (cytochrome)